MCSPISRLPQHSLTLPRLTRWLSTFTAAWFSLKLLQSKTSTAFMEGPFTTSTGIIVRPTRFAGRTMDLTLFAVTRAFDVIVGELWSQRKARRVAAGKWTKVIISTIGIDETLTIQPGRESDLEPHRLLYLCHLLRSDNVGLDLHTRPSPTLLQQMDQIRRRRRSTSPARITTLSIWRNQIRS